MTLHDNLQPVAEIKQVRKVIGRKTIIDNLTFDIFPGEVCGFLGPNGAGKTTTIRMMTGLMSITAGQILINGYDVQRNFEKAMARVGGVVENPEVYRHLTGYQNLIHYSRMYKGIGRERIDEVISQVGLEKRIKDKVKSYSLGMRQRLGLAQALLHNPNLLVFDEPTNGLDPEGIRELRDYLRLLAAVENISIFVSSHLLSEMELMCDRICIIQQGKLVEIQRVNDFLNGMDKQHNLRIRFVTEPLEEARTCLMGMLGEERVELDRSCLNVSAKRQEIPGLVAQLVQSGVDVFGVEVRAKTLEDKFLEVTGGNEIV